MVTAEDPLVSSPDLDHHRVLQGAFQRRVGAWVVESNCDAAIRGAPRLHRR